MSSDTESVSNMDQVMATIKTLESADLFKLMKTVVSEVEKKTKQTSKTSSKASTAKKTGSMPKGSIPPQLRKPRAWVEYTLQHALENGWEAFTIHQTHKDKETGEKTEEVIEMPASILHEGAHVFADSVNEKNPTGKQLIHKDAMSLSKQRKKANHPTYAEFEAQYVDDSVDDDSKSTTSSTKSSKIVKKTAAEKEAEKEAKKKEKEAEKEQKKKEKEAEKEAKKAEKEAEKAAKKAEKEAEKAEKASSKSSVTKAPIPAAAVKKTTKEDKPVETAKPAPKKKPAAKADEIPADGMVHPWSFEGKQYFRNSDGETWLRAKDGSCGEWAGLYDPSTNKLDTSAPEPEFADEE